MRTSQRGIDLIKEFEGFRGDAYPDPGSGGEPYTIGYGTTRYAGRGKVKMGDSISEKEAEKYLSYDVIMFETAVQSLVEVPLTQNQFDALVSFAYNLGTTALAGSTLLRELNKGRYESAAGQFERWVYASGKKLKGLIRRRIAEKQLFQCP
ncbi:MAG: lysozyme [Sphingobacterium sp.]